MYFHQGKFTHFVLASRAAAFTLCVLLLANVSFGQLRTLDPRAGKSQAEIKTNDDSLRTGLGPYYIETTYEGCKALFDRGGPEYAHMTTFWEMRIGTPTPNGSFPLVNAAPVSIFGGMTENPNLAINISSSGSNVNSWSLGPPQFLDRAVSAIVISGVNGGTGLYVYTYPTLAVSDVGPFSTPPIGNQFPQVNAVSFCFEPFTAPSSADATISGRALTTAGRGIANVRMELTDLSTGTVRYAMTNPFGYYTFEEVPVATLYMVRASHKRYTFFDNDRTITLEDNLTGLDFVAE